MASVTASTIPPTAPANSAASAGAVVPEGTRVIAGEGEAVPADPPKTAPHTGSLARRMMVIAALWIVALLLLGGIALDRAMTNLVSRQFDAELERSLTALLASAEIDPWGDVRFNRPLSDQRFLEPYSGYYWQITGEGKVPYLSRSLWDERLDLPPGEPVSPEYSYTDQIENERLRMVRRSVQVPGSDVKWQFAVAGSLAETDAQLHSIRLILIWSFAILGIGLFLMAIAQTWYGLGPLRRIRIAIAHIRTAGSNRVTDPLPLEVQPMVLELNALLAHSERQAEEARTHAGNLAHALKTPLTVLTNAANAHDGELPSIALREAEVMRRQVDHHLARARAVGRRAVGLSRADVMASAKGVQRAVERLYPAVRFDIAGNHRAEVTVEPQDLDEILGNLIENAAKYGGGSVFVTVDSLPGDPLCAIWVEDDGAGIPEELRGQLFSRGARLDTEKPGTGLGLAIVRDVAEIYGGAVSLGESEDLGGLLVELKLPRAS